MKFFFALLIGVCGLAGYGFFELNEPYGGFTERKFVDIPRGTSTNAVARALKAQGVVQSEWIFLAARATAPGAKLQAGEYAFDHPSSPLDVVRKIARGDVYFEEITIPEGQNIFDIAATVAKSKLFKEAEFLQAARDPSLIRDLDPEAATLEGYLWPDTYRVARTTTAADLCQAMVRRFRAIWKEVGGNRKPHGVVTLASLVEREARLPSDRPLVASVFSNRLERGIKLDCDPTTVYAAMLEGRYRGTIHRSDLDSPNPYNTYKNPGLPPGPIANRDEAPWKRPFTPPKRTIFSSSPNRMGPAAITSPPHWPNTTRRPARTEVPLSAKRRVFEELVRTRGWTAIGEDEWRELRLQFSESSLRGWFAESVLAVKQPYRGVQTKSLDDLESSLRELAEVYDREPEARTVCRATVIAAKDRTRFASRNLKVDPVKRSLKAEMVQWMLVWLDDPGMFAAWVELRRKSLAEIKPFLTGPE